MWTRVAPIVLGVVVLGAGAFALLRSNAPTEPSPAPTTEREPAASPQSELPPGHPAVPSQGEAPQVAPEPASGPGGVTWTVPSDWQTVSNPSPMRLATYRVSGSGGDAEMAVSRAGGSVDANVERWRGQFVGNDATTKRAERTVHGLKVTIVELDGTYKVSAMMMPGGGGGEPHPGWALLAAIVETSGAPYFFKLVGPEAAVRAARPRFDAMISSVTPS
jgi:hypothetical protein